jgi:hypothetical protein
MDILIMDTLFVNNAISDAIYVKKRLIIVPPAWQVIIDN